MMALTFLYKNFNSRAMGILFVDLGQSHNPEVAGSNPAPATMKTRILAGFLFIDI